MAKVSVYVTPALRRLMGQHSLNWSQVAQDAFLRAIANHVGTKSEYGPYVPPRNKK